MTSIDKNALARSLMEKMTPHVPEGIGVTMVLVDYNTPEGEIAYISTACRKDMREALRGLLEHWDKQEWGAPGKPVGDAWGKGKTT